MAEKEKRLTTFSTHLVNCRHITQQTAGIIVHGHALLQVYASIPSTPFVPRTPFGHMIGPYPTVIERPRTPANSQAARLATYHTGLSNTLLNRGRFDAGG